MCVCLDYLHFDNFFFSHLLFLPKGIRIQKYTVIAVETTKIISALNNYKNKKGMTQNNCVCNRNYFFALFHF